MGAPAPQGVSASGTPPAAEQNGIGANAVVQGTIAGVGPTAPFAFRGPINLAIWASINTTLTTTAGSSTGVVASATGLAAGQNINGANVPAGTTIGSIATTNATMAFPPITLPGIVNLTQAKISGLPRTAGLVGATVTGRGIPAGTTVSSVETAAIAKNANNSGSTGTVVISATPTLGTQSPGTPDQFQFAVTNNVVLTGADTAALFTGYDILYVGNIQLERSFDGGATFLPCNIGGSGAIAAWSAGSPVNITFGEPEKRVLYRLNCLAYTSGVINFRMSQTGVAAESLSVAPPI